MCNECNWEELLENIDGMLDDPNYEFAQDTLEGIAGWVKDNEYCTEGQEVAVRNIANSVDERMD